MRSKLGTENSKLDRWYDTATILGRFPVLENTGAKIETFSLTRQQANDAWLRDFQKMGPEGAWLGMIEPDRTYVKLSTRVPGMFRWDTLEMSNTRMEFLTNLPLLDHAKGRVLIAGLGLGLVVQELNTKLDVESITVIEKNPYVAALVAPQFERKEKVQILQGDAYTAYVEGLFDTIYFDIWPDMNYPAAERRKLYHRYRSRLGRGGVMWSWGGNIPKQWKGGK